MIDILGITERSDNTKEELIYYVGSNGQIPIVLLALIASRHRNAVERYISYFSYTETGQSTANELYNLNPDINIYIKEIVDIFDGRDAATQAKMLAEVEKNGLPVFEGFPPPPDDIGEYIDNYPRDAIVDFSLYANQLATYMAMLTPNYDTGREGTPQTCSMSYIAFWRREEFKNVNKAVETAFNYVLSEIVRIMKLRNIPINEKNMTLNIPNYKSVIFTREMYPGF